MIYLSEYKVLIDHAGGHYIVHTNPISCDFEYSIDEGYTLADIAAAIKNHTLEIHPETVQNGTNFTEGGR